ncbi:MAG: hypothetical protein WC900_08380, partial [Oscillospiraceae bacterium]
MLLMLTAFLYTLAICFVGECSDLKNEALLSEAYIADSTIVEEYKSDQVSLWKAGISEYTILEEEEAQLPPATIFEAITQEESPEPQPLEQTADYSQTTTAAQPEQTADSLQTTAAQPEQVAAIQTESPAEAASPAPKYAAEAFTVYDQNT